MALSDPRHARVSPVAAPLTRRRLWPPLFGMLVALGICDDSQAKKKRKKRKKRKKPSPPAAPPIGCPNGCGFNERCADGICVPACLGGQIPCGVQCCSGDESCLDNRQCVIPCTDGRPRCGGICCGAARVCDDEECVVDCASNVPCGDGCCSTDEVCLAGGCSPYEFLFAFGGPGSGAGMLNRPRGVAVDGDDNVYVADGDNHRIAKYDADGVFLGQIGSQRGNGTGQFNTPQGVHVAANGDVYVADTVNDRIQKFIPDPQHLNLYVHAATFGGSGSGQGQLSRPTDLVVDDAGNIYVVEGGNGRIQKLNSDGVHSAFWPTNATPLGGIALAADGTILFANSTQNRIDRYEDDGTPLGSLGASGSEDGAFLTPRHIDVDADGNVFVVDGSSDRIQKFEPDAESPGSYSHAATWGRSASISPPLPGEFEVPLGIAVDGSGSVLVSDFNQNRIQVFVPVGEAMRQRRAASRAGRRRGTRGLRPRSRSRHGQHDRKR
jgi:sugar lactone lactonase YvrE